MHRAPSGVNGRLKAMSVQRPPPAPSRRPPRSAEPPPSQKRKTSWLAHFLWFAVLAALAAAAILGLYFPMSQELEQLKREIGQSQADRVKLTGQVNKLTQSLDELQEKNHRLSGKVTSVTREKEAALAALKQLENQLSEPLQAEIAAGQVLIRRDGGRIIIDVADKILFDTGKADINEGGRRVLAEVASAMKNVGKYVFQVGGHTDNQKVVQPATLERFPTNWELSSARATNVVRFLHEESKVPGARLYAAGFSEFRPRASNNSENSRARNRRIEIALVPPSLVSAAGSGK